MNQCSAKFGFPDVNGVVDYIFLAKFPVALFHLV